MRPPALNGRSTTRRTGPARRSPGSGAGGPPPAQAAALTLAEREAAVLARERDLRVRGEAADRRERIVDRREAVTTQREQALLAREAAARARAQDAARLRSVNERLVLTSIDAQTRAEAADQVAAAMSRTAHHDGLTGLPNRILLGQRLERSMALALRQGHRVALLFMDLDHFKQINDTFGHPAGDLLLQSVARRLQDCVRQTDTVCRLGGDEFVVLLPEIKGRTEARLAARKMIAAMAPVHYIAGHPVSVTMSIGISYFPDHGGDAQAVLRAADLAMYQAKQRGRNALRVFTECLRRAPVQWRQQGQGMG